jgi:hypothetical protein
MIKRFIILTAGILMVASCSRKDGYLEISPEVLRDKIAGGWAGKMIGVTYGAPTEFRATGKTFEDSIKWTPDDIKNSMWQDDLYVQLTFMMAMDRYGAEVPAKKLQEMLAKAGYQLWHANVQSRKNYFDSIFPPQSGMPEFNYHADDIDFQIEADYIGFMCPGMPQSAIELCNTAGSVMNYGDGIYGGIFVSALYAAAFFESDVDDIIEKALKAIPAGSDYAAIIRDVMLLHRHYPDNWRAAWKELEDKWGAVDICGAGDPFNIDAKLNGAYIVMGLAYGDGDPLKTLEITTRCGQDSDCNPSNALAVLGVIKGFSNLPENMRNGVLAVADSIFIYTDYSFNKAVESSYRYAMDFITKGGGTIKGDRIRIKRQQAEPPALEISFPDVVFDRRVSVFDNTTWKMTGDWQHHKTIPWGQKTLQDQSVFSDHAGDVLEFTFEGTGMTLNGNWVRDGGKADIYIDGEFRRTIDSYFYYGGQEHYNMNVWHVFGLVPGKHTLRLVVRGEKRPESRGCRLYISEAVVFKAAPKNNRDYKFSFEN